VTQLETNLSAREQEILVYDAKYRKCVEKAKEVIKSIDPRIASGKLFTHYMDKNLIAYTLALDASVLEKSADLVEEEPKPKMSVMEEQLMTSAFYRLGVNAQRDAIDSKLAILMGSGQTFLARQRQSAPRKSLSAMKSK